MRIKKPGKITDGLWFLGDEDSSIYLLEGKDSSILINGGLSYVVPDMLEQFREFGIDESKITKFLILHSHFDHVGVVPFFKRRYPDLVIYASSRSFEIFKKPKALQAINASSNFLIEQRMLTEACAEFELEWFEGITGETVSDGDTIKLGDYEVCIIETPGHSPCSVSAYVPQLQALFPSDSGGLPQGEKEIVTNGASNFTDFEKSLLKLNDLKVKLICSDHYGYVTGDEATNYIAGAIKAAKTRRNIMVDIYQRTGNLDEATREFFNMYKHENSAKIVPDEIFIESFRQMMMHVVGLKK